MKHDQSVTPGPSGVSRRTVVKGAAWAVPAIAVASAVPAMAASQPCVAFSYSGSPCKDPGTPFGYRFLLCIDTGNCDDTEFYPITVTSIDANNGTYLTDSQWSQNGQTPGSPTTTVTFNSDGQCELVKAFAHGSPNELTFNYTLSDGVTTGSFSLPAPPSTGGCTVGTTTTTTTTTDAGTTTTTTTTA